MTISVEIEFTRDKSVSADDAVDKDGILETLEDAILEGCGSAIPGWDAQVNDIREGGLPVRKSAK